MSILTLYHGSQKIIEKPIFGQGNFYLRENFLIDLSNFDAIIGYRADDSYFSFAKAFLSNAISYKQLQFAMKLGKLGEQIMIKSQKAFDLIQFKGYEIAESKIYLPLRTKRDSEARTQFKNLLDEDDISGLFIRDLILQKVKNDDERLR